MAILGYENQGADDRFRKALGAVIYEIIKKGMNDVNYMATDAETALNLFLKNYDDLQINPRTRIKFGKVKVLEPLANGDMNELEDLPARHSVKVQFDNPAGDRGGGPAGFRDITRVVIPVELPLHKALPAQKMFLGSYFMRKCR